MAVLKSGCFLMSEVPLYGTAEAGRPGGAMMYSKRHLPVYRAVEPSSGSNIIPRRAHPDLAGLSPHDRAVDQPV